MKKWIPIMSVCCAALLTACHNDKGRFLDLSTGDTVTLVKDSGTGHWVSATTGKPVNLYVDTRSHDTIYGPSGEVVNGHVSRNTSGIYVYDGDPKVKRDGEEYKEKYENGAKYKVEDEESKYKDKNIKVKTEDGETKTKPNKTIKQHIKDIF